MSLHDTPASERVHIGFFGRRNAGKSTVVNAVTGQNLSVVSSVKGTTTDPVRKAMELLPLGPVLIIDTPGFDDSGELGELRVQKALQTLETVDIAVLVSDASEGLCDVDKRLIDAFKARNITYMIAYNKCDLLSDPPPPPASDSLYISARDMINIDRLRDMLSALSKNDDPKLRIIADLISPSDFVVLVTPIDKAAPKGRLILPQQQVIRDIIEADAVAMITKEHELRETLEYLGKKPRLVVTDSQVFAKVSADVPKDIPLTSFSILFARYKGLLETAVDGVKALDGIKNGDNILICEGCTHHRQCDDIGTVKLPRWIREYTGVAPNFSFTSGSEFPENLSEYKLIVHCGGCTLNERAVRYRMRLAQNARIPITNYGILIAYMQGILERSVAVFGL
jgi:[FeFe] hydrogenase H-cluster maturation GTPase HydF